ncbi:DUF1874 domain-containing protein [Zoogloea sp.]|uniref:STIV orfB116 family protein n=1 Tax=Zoogloea sp. TaxID=49181 RepID=UPI00261DE1A4|nr:DUF1874 domain-containing protein [Zoogloea sp.]
MQHASSSALASPIWLLNAPIITADGLFRSRTIPLLEAQQRVHEHGFESAIGHAPTAAILSELLGIECPMCRIEFEQAPGQLALVFRLARRMEEGRVLQSRAEIEAVGFSFLLLVRES